MFECGQVQRRRGGQCLRRSEQQQEVCDQASAQEASGPLEQSQNGAVLKNDSL